MRSAAIAILLLHTANDAVTASSASHQARRTAVAPLNTFVAVKDEFDARQAAVESVVFQTLHAFSMNGEDMINSQSKTSPSRIYTYNDFFESLRSLSVGGIYGQSYHVKDNPYYSTASSDNNDQSTANFPSDTYVNHQSNNAFYISQPDPDAQNAILYGIVNICAFLANAMVESIRFDSCEEWNGMGTGGIHSASSSRGNTHDFLLNSGLSAVHGRYFPMANACGQFGKLYSDNSEMLCLDHSGVGGFQNYTGSGGVDMSCPIDTSLEIEAAAHPKYNHPPGTTQQQAGANTRKYGPPPFYCGPKRRFNRYSGYWDGYSQEFVRDVAYPSALGKVDVEGCCYWGRGALSTKNVCNLGKLNYYLGSRAYTEGRPSRYPNIDFCKNPWIICDTNRVLENGLVYPELKWMVGIFEWIDRVQSYDNRPTNWNYMTQLKLFVDRGAQDSNFIDTVSSIVARGCDDDYCSTQPIPYLEERRHNFETLIYDIFDIQSSLKVVASSSSSAESGAATEKQLRYDYKFAERWIQSKRTIIESNVFVSQNEALDGMPYYSTAYQFNSFISALRSSSLFGLTDSKVFFLGDASKGLRGLNAGLVNLAAFLANAMAESITTDSCDEVGWEKGATGCGQNGRDYSSESCPQWQSFMTCAVNPQMEMEAQTPITDEAPFLLSSSPSPFKCYPGNQTFISAVAGCCYWGRGALATRGTCNLGKLNFHLGARAKSDNRPSIYPDINFCANPSAICNHNDTMTVRWVVAMFEWIDRVQSYYHANTEWQYMGELYKFVDGGMQDEAFIDSVNRIFGTNCHLRSCDLVTSIKANNYRYGFEKQRNLINIIRLVFDLPAVANQSTESPVNPPAFGPAIPNIYANMDVLKQLYPSAAPTLSPMEAVITVAPTTSPLESRFPTSSPVEFSNITVFNDGGSYIVDENVLSFADGESIIISDKTKLTLIGGNVTAPDNSEWPAIRLSVGSTINATSGVVKGSNVGDDFDEGGEGIHLSNGQSSPQTAGYGEFYDGIRVIGGNGRIGGSALIVNGFGTEAVIYGGSFIGGSGENVDLDGYSVRVINSAVVHIHGGDFIGVISVEGNAVVMLYGCFTQNDTEVNGLFAGEVEANLTIDGDGELAFLPAADQECETIPSVAPTSFPTTSPQPTADRNGAKRVIVPAVVLAVDLFSIFKYFI